MLVPSYNTRDGWLRDKTYLVLAIDNISAANPTRRTVPAHGSRAIITPARASLPVRTIARHVARVPADSADDVGCVILALWAVILAVTNLPTVLTGLVLIVPERSVQGS